ncbi:MAG: hypothetical protein J0L56_08950 [Chitinophagales bacterium]|nr:hypothetical protein [Chitinophagales bacterium]
MISSKVKLLEQSWENNNYSISNTGGTFGTISFTDSKEFIGVAFSKESSRNPFSISQKSDYSYKPFLNEVPDNLYKIATEECLQYMIQGYKGKNLPIITSAFWGNELNTFVNEKWEDALTNGLFIYHNHFLSFEKSLLQWQSYYELSDADIKQIRIIVSKISLTGNKLLSLDGKILSYFKTKEEAGNGFDLFKEQLGVIGIII